MKRKFFSLAIVLMLTVSVMFTVAGMSLFAAAQGDASMDATGSVSVSDDAAENEGAGEGSDTSQAVNTWLLASHKNLTIEYNEGIARIKETTHSSTGSVIDVITNAEGYDVTKAIEFDMYLYNLPFDYKDAVNPAATDYWIGLFLYSEYTDEFYTVQQPNGTLNFNMRGYKDENGSYLTGLCSMPDGRKAGENTDKNYSGEDQKITIRFEVADDYTTVYQKTSATDDYVEWFFIPEIGRDFFADGKVYFNMRFHVSSGATNPELFDLGLSTVRNTETFNPDVGNLYIPSDDITVAPAENGDKTEVAVNAAAGSLYYRVPFDLNNKLEINFTINQTPGYHEAGVDSWVGMFLSNGAGVHSPFTKDSYGIWIRSKNETQLGGYFASPAAAQLAQSLVVDLREGENTVVFEMQKSILVISLNEKSYSLSVGENYYVGKNGYLCFYANIAQYTGENGYKFTYSITNDSPVVLPQIALKDPVGQPFAAKQDEDLTFSYEGDRFLSLSGYNITENDYSADAEAGTVTIKKEFLQHLPTGMELSFCLNGEQSSADFSLQVQSTGITQIVTVGSTFSYDKSSAEGLSVGVSGDVFVSVSGNDIRESDYSFTTAEPYGTLLINRSYFTKLPNGEYIFTLNGEATSSEFTVNVQGQTAEPIQIMLQTERGTFDGNAPADVEIYITQGVAVNVVGNVIMSGDFTLGVGKVTLVGDYLAALKNGEYVFRIYEDEGTCAEFTLTVTNSKVTETEPPAPSGGDASGESGGGCSSSAVGSLAVTAAVLCAAAVALAAAMRQKSNKENK